MDVEVPQSSVRMRTQAYRELRGDARGPFQIM